MSLSPFLKSAKQHLPIIILILVNLVIGTAVVQDFGESWDEPIHNAYGVKSMQAYQDLLTSGNLPSFRIGDPVNYGPAYTMTDLLLGQGLHTLVPAWSAIDGRHFVDFITFQIGIVSLYFLSKKWMSKWAAFGVATLFSTQPLLWGHAFMNPKDIPFLGFFLASVTLGIYMVDSLPASIDQASHRQPDLWSIRQLRDEWEQARDSWKKVGVAFLVIYLLPILGMITGISNLLVSIVVNYLYHADKTSRLGAWFSRYAANAAQIPVSNYIHRAQAILFRLEIYYALGGLMIGLLIFPWIFPRYFRRFIRQGLIPFPKRTLRLYSYPMVLVAGLILGYTTSIRIAAPYAGILVFLYAFYKSWRKAILLLIPYASIAILITYLTWPFLWADPLNHLIESMTLMSRFPFQERILFQNIHYLPADLPRYFLPYLITVQLTEPVLILFLLGFVLITWNFIKGRQLEPLLMTILWLILPVLLIIFYHSTLYDNFRQYLFLLPPIFITAGIGLEAIFKKIKWIPVQALILSILLLPGVFADVSLHPYQYVYYNSLVGGVRGAYHKYELDYWGTSYREAAQYVNATAPQNANIVVLGPVKSFQDFARPDLTITPIQSAREGIRYTFVVSDNRLDLVNPACQTDNPIKTIGRGGAIFAFIKTPPASISECK
jgi:hypothetical protein